MGQMIHHAIVITTRSEKGCDDAIACGRALGLQIVGPSAPSANGMRSFMIGPDNGMDVERIAAQRDLFEAYMTEHQGELDWAHVTYGGDLMPAPVSSGEGHELVTGEEPHGS